MNPLIAVVGLGSIGKRHVTNLLEMGHQDIFGIDPNVKYCTEDRIPVLKQLDDIEACAFTHAIICTPPRLHLSTATRFLRRGIPVLVEKPLGTTVSEANLLLGDHVAVGYMERANKTVLDAFSFAQQNTVKNAYIELYWKMTQKTYDQDFMLESSHAFDTARFILGDMKMVSCTVTDTSAEVRLAHAGGYTFVTIHADALPMRRINLYAHNGKAFGRQYGHEEGEWDLCYKAQLQAFLDGKPLCSARDGLAVMEIIEDMRAAG